MKKLGITLLFAWVGFAAVASAGKTVRDDRPIHEIHSMMIYNFVKYIQWPDNSQEFIIGVMGNDEVYNTLKTWYDGKVRGNKKFIIKKYNSPAEIQESHILYVGNSTINQFTAIKNKVGSASTLIITDKPGMGAKGSGINFKTVNNKLAFELNQSAIEKSDLKVSSQLTAMAILI